MTSEEFAKSFIALDIPLTEEEWGGLSELFEKLSPGITDHLLSETKTNKPLDADGKKPPQVS